MNVQPNFSDYQIAEQLYAGTRTLVYRGIRTHDQQPVVIKILQNEYPKFTELLQFRNQYTLAKNLNLPSIIQVLSLEKYRNSYALIMEDFGGVSLSEYLKIVTDESPKFLPVAEFLNIGIQLTDILHYLYQNRVIHKDIKPANILIHPETKQVKLIDFSISSLLPRETQEIQNPKVLEGTLAYLSPEQTGRMNRGIDYRSDFYSLGITLYELLTGKLPFVSEDPMELVHCHLAKHPIPIHQINPQIPLALSEIVSKLMAKNAEDRYQTALGIKHDLEICLKELQTKGQIESFEIGKRDISDRFIIPEKLYGRETEVNQLLAAFERVSTGNTEIMLVAGFSGIGKTAVVNEVHKPIVRQRGYFIKGKYDQFQRNIPFSAFVQAFRDLMGQLLSESDAELQAWKNQIIVAVGENGQVLIDVIPELENIIGKQPPATELSGSAAQNRFNLLFQKFVQVFTNKEHPLVMFLDDLQWADSASLNLLKLLLQDTEYLLVLGAYRDNEVFNSSANPTYRFLHDRVQQAAYSLIPDDQKQATHLKIGQLLQEKSSEIEREEKLFDIVGHLNLGQTFIVQPKEREALAQLNLEAGVKARSSTAYAAAKFYLQIGIELLEADCWFCQYELTLNLYVAATEVAYLNADFERMELLAALVLQEAQTIFDKVKIYEIQIAARTAQSQMLESLATGRNALLQLGVELPTEPDEVKISESLQDLASQLQGRPIQELVDLPVMSDPTSLAAMQLLGKLLTPIFIVMPGLLPLLSSTMVRLSLQFGNAPASTEGYAIHGMVLCVFWGEVETGYGFGKLALSLLDKFNIQEYKSMILNTFGGFIQHHQETLTAARLTLKDGYTAGMETGDFLNASFNIVVYNNMGFFAGVELDSCESDLAAYSTALAQIKQYSPQVYVDMMWQTVKNLREAGIPSDCLLGTAYDETVMIPKHHQDNELGAIAHVYINKLLLAYIWGNYSAAINYIAQAKLYLIAVSGLIYAPIFHFYAALTYLAIFPTKPEPDQSEILALMETHQTTLHQWAQNAPMNHLHKWYLVEAEKYRVLGNKAEAIELYDRAISLANENQFINEEALANELAAKFYLNWGKEKIAPVYMQEAYYCYARWGAKAKVVDLEQRYPQLLAPILQQPRTTNSLKETLARGTISATHTSSTVSEALDLTTLLKASQAISGEIELNQLLTTLLKIVITNAGASKCVLLLKQDPDLKVVALVAEGESPQLLPSIPLEISADVAISLVNNVKRTLEPLVLVDASLNSQFAADSYIQRHQPKSVLCSPILNQGRLIGVLYLENNLTVGAFTSDRIEILNLICAQAAISLENARLYQAAQQALTDLQQAQLTIVQSEKMSALGNLVAGVAHEINNPVGFLGGNIQPALDYINDLFGLFDLVQEKYPQLHPDVQEEIENIELDYIREDLPKLVISMREGVKRIADISTSLRTFSRADTNYPVACNIHDGIDSTIMILKHRLKANENRPEIKVVKDYGNLPQIECYAGQLNQVFMNLLSNAIDALEDSNQGRKYAEIANEITVKTELSEDKKQAIIRIADNGIGMSEEVQSKIFDHLFTTKGVGKGTGLGLAIARQIIEEKHGGELICNSTVGVGTEFAIALPLKK